MSLLFSIRQQTLKIVLVFQKVLNLKLKFSKNFQLMQQNQITKKCHK